MKHIFSTAEFDELKNAFYRCNLKEAVQPRSESGKIIEDSDTYNRVQKLLATPEMEEAHGFLYDIDFDHLNDGIVSKVDSLYNLAIDKGFIQDENVAPVEEPDFSEDPLTNDGVGSEKAPFMNDTLDSAYTCLYSAMKDGELKTGECFSNAKDTQSAKADAISKLANLGFTSIEIIAIEQGDPASRGTPNVSNVDNIESPKFKDYMDRSENETEEVEVSDKETITEAEESEDETKEEVSDTEEVKDEPAEDTSSEDPLLADVENETSEDESSEEESGETEEKETEEKSEEETIEEDPSEDSSEDETEEKTTEKETEKETSTKDSESEEKSDSKEETKDSEETTDSDLSKAEILEMVEKFVNLWKQTLKNMDKESYHKLTLKERAKFFKDLDEQWEDKKHDPADFMNKSNWDTMMDIEIVL